MVSPSETCHGVIWEAFWALPHGGPRGAFASQGCSLPSAPSEVGCGCCSRGALQHWHFMFPSRPWTETQPGWLLSSRRSGSQQAPCSPYTGGSCPLPSRPEFRGPGQQTRVPQYLDMDRCLGKPTAKQCHCRASDPSRTTAPDRH